eukprot:CAMPEP_0175086198 /NCGR_PEP_ID=MMETSP0052_2-20121109/29103_1 /TAXON_ID=51329 ORGANISM="Polytomella parva, Strain SAG 63-3" /NCGR_SAMPLE_ID=MMETSP0052_2 /ASSEMBLY_ACC=CAM_ASM_000194 /LENGTH=458 /DNA_ID=CAMNT_0016358329 /DNA_START=4301 /DNA_END=5677 /DNA_ORIENTATION=-
MAKFGKAMSVSGLIIFGTTTSLLAKIVYELQSVGLDGNVKYFHKPWAMTSLMFVGMSLSLPGVLIQEALKKKKKKKSDLETFLIENEEEKKTSSWSETLLLAIPTIFDLIATILMNVGLLYVTASVYQMMRGAEMLFAAFFAVVFLKRKLNKYHFMGLLCCVCGVVLVGASSLLSGSGSATQTISKTQMLLGMSLIILSQAVQAAQLTIEDFFMADLDVPGDRIVGYEGLFGVFFTLVIMAPICYYLPGPEGEGFHENIFDTFEMIKNSRALPIVMAVDTVALLMYNLTGMAVTGHLGAVFRTVLETLRTLFVWLVDLILFYTPLGMGMLGEKWTKYSFVQAAGFVVLVTGTLVYREGDRRAEKEEVGAEETVDEVHIEGYSPHPVQSHVHIPPTAAATMIPVPIRTPSAPISVSHSLRNSFRPNQTIVAGSYSRSITNHSYITGPRMGHGIAIDADE